MRVLRFSLVVCLLLASGLARADGQTIQVTSQSPVAHQLAVLEAGTGSTASVASVKAFESILATLERQCTQPQEGIADLGVMAVRGLRKAGKKIGYLEFLKAMSASIPPKAGKLDCREVGAALWTMLEAQR
jgi:hypothetical protein